jgi:hypothetical protein
VFRVLTMPLAWSLATGSMERAQSIITSRTLGLVLGDWVLDLGPHAAARRSPAPRSEAQ